jgi:prevent-host-death family protein
MYNNRPMKVTSSQARQNFAALLERVLAGEEVSIERHGRPVARLIPAGRRAEVHAPARRDEADVAEVRGIAPDSPLSRILRGRALTRLEVARPRAEAAVSRLKQGGVKARIIGSLARGSFRQTSDVDILVEDPGSSTESSIEEMVRSEMGDFPFDVVYAHRLPARLRRHVVP